ncbi:hypothetical protein FGB62_209g05 [Gracilaria domingensis]|nr:hypothetical protein FGB62_209g05 [Gracilaria domingensis]
MFRAGELTGNENVSEVKNMDPLSKPYKSTTFRLRYGRIRTEMLGHGQPAAALFVARTTKDDEVSAQPRLGKTEPKEYFVPNDHLEASDDTRRGEFKPIWLLSEWEHDESTIKHISLVVLFPSSVHENHIVPQVVDDGYVLELKVQWPTPMTNMAVLRKKWLSKQFQAMLKYHPVILGFNRTLKALRESTSDCVYSIC